MSNKTFVRIIAFLCFLVSMPLTLFILIMAGLGRAYHPENVIAHVIAYLLAALCAIAGLYFFAVYLEGKLDIFDRTDDE